MTELLVILVVGLLVLGPKRLPELARSLGRGLAEFRRASTDMRREFLDVQDELRIDPTEEDSTAAKDDPAAASKPPEVGAGSEAEADEADPKRDVASQNTAGVADSPGDKASETAGG